MITFFVVYLIIYHKRLCRTVLMLPTNKHTANELSNWTIGHFVLFGVLGYLNPCKTTVHYAVVLGICWEFTELYLTVKAQPENVTVQKFLKRYFLRDPRKRNDDDPQMMWCGGGFYGQIADIATNILGLFAGVYVFHILHQNHRK